MFNGKFGGGVKISIHAPREGSDRLRQHAHRHGLYISIHAPREGSDTFQFMAKEKAEAISIHAPREGSDQQQQTGCKTANGFLSTLPVRGATTAHADLQRTGPHFYPRSP